MRKKLSKAPKRKQAPRAAPESSRFADLSTHKLIQRFLRLDRVMSPAQRPRHRPMERRVRTIELHAVLETEIGRRAGSDQEAMDFLAQRFVDRWDPLVKVHLPEVPPNLDRLSNEELDRLTADVAQRNARFTEFYPKLDGGASRFVREALNAGLESLRAERKRRGLASSPTGTETPFGKKALSNYSSSRAVELEEREKRILAVIQQGSKGRQYCRELDNANTAPPRTGIWKDCPRKYDSAYLQGEPWRHRIQDEKSKIRRKAKLAGLGKLAGE